MKKMSLVFIFVSMFLAVGITSSFAANGICEKATVISAGAFYDGNAVKVRNDEGINFNGWCKGCSIWVTLHPNNQDAMLATALTAKSLTKFVTVVAPSNVYVNWGIATQVFMNE